MSDHDPLCPTLHVPLREGNECLLCLCIRRARDDEANRVAARYPATVAEIRTDERRDLRARVEALQEEAGRTAFDLGGDHYFQGMEEGYRKMLALLDGSSENG